MINYLPVVLFVWLWPVLGNTYRIVSSKMDDQYNRDINEFFRTSPTTSRPSLAEYTRLRETLMSTEMSRRLGSKLILNEEELRVNDILMAVKKEELSEGWKNPHLFNPSQHFFSVLDRIRKSKLYKLLERMPKGAVLHTHDMAMCSTDYVIGVTYRPNLWVCSNKQEVEKFRFSKRQPPTEVNCTWDLVENVRRERGAESFDDYLRTRISLYPIEKFLDNNSAWESFRQIFRLLLGLLTYAPVWGDYFYRGLKEFYADGVQYVEFRTVLPELYDLDGRTYRGNEVAEICQHKLKEFQSSNAGFIGAKLIYGPLRYVEAENVEQYLKTAIELKRGFPNFFAGFDLVGQEELGRPLIDFLPQLLNVPEDIHFFFHAGETNWYGSSTDENLIDAVLLGSKRIGHGYALIKHPSVLEMLKEKDIAVEVNPISNQVLQLVSDLRNHPASALFADDYPVVVSSDDPSLWRASPLSHDFYVTFLGLASAHSDLRFLKQLAINSIQYSALSEDEKVVAFMTWKRKWNDFISQTVRSDNLID